MIEEIEVNESENLSEVLNSCVVDLDKHIKEPDMITIKEYQR